MRGNKKDVLVRKIVDFKKLNDEILSLLVEKYPDGYDERDIITFRNAQNEVVEAVEVRSDDTLFLVKIGTRLIEAMDDYEPEEDEEEEENDDDFEDFGEEFIDD
jgi:DNA-directed RNA polymerase subunit delta